MKFFKHLKWMVVLIVVVAAGFTIAQDYQRRFGGRRSYGQRSYDQRRGVPNWENRQDFADDVFTFVRIAYDSHNGNYGWRGGGRNKWRTDYPDADLNLSFRLKQLTSLKVDPDGRIIRLTDASLFDFPFIYIIEPGHLIFTDEEVLALRKYLEKGGFLMVDDFWGEDEWANFHREIKRVFPDKEPEDVPLDHEIFHIVYDLKEKPQIPSVHAYLNGQRTERYDADYPNYRAIKDDQDRIMVFICHNTDLGDGWEREGVDKGYFETYSEPFAYPLGINIVTYAMTH